MNDQPATTNLKLFMILLGSKARGRHIEQHDVFFGIGTSLKDLIPEIKGFWPEAGNSLHLDGYREVASVDGHRVTVVAKSSNAKPATGKKLFFINLGGYQANKLEEQHYTLLTVKADRADASKEAKATLFFQLNRTEGGGSHIDDKYGVDVDDLHQIEDILSPAQKEMYRIGLVEGEGLADDKIVLGYFPLKKLELGWAG